jgi:hypothetical protein
MNRHELIQKAASLSVGHPERKKILAHLKGAGRYTDNSVWKKRDIQYAMIEKPLWDMQLDGEITSEQSVVLNREMNKCLDRIVKKPAA